MVNQVPRLLIFAFSLSAVVLGAILFHCRSGQASQGSNPVNVSRITVEHLRVVTDKPFDQVTKAFEQQLGKSQRGNVQVAGRG